MHAVVLRPLGNPMNVHRDKNFTYLVRSLEEPHVGAFLEPYSTTFKTAL